MNNYVILTDSGCDISPEILRDWGVPHLSLTFRFTDENTEHSNDDMDITEFYNKMRQGGVAKTAAINVQTFSDSFEAILKEGKDILYLGFSSGLSTTYNSARLAADGLRCAYPDRKIITVDTLSASAGQGLLVYFACQKRDGGASMEEVAEYIESIKLKLCHWFTVDDLVYLRRGGRVSGVKAFVGNMLGIKPVLHVDNDGHLISMSTVRGRKTSIKAIADKYDELADKNADRTVFICHADCTKDAEALRDEVKARHGIDTKIITDIGPVIGAHSGPGTLALFFLGTER